MAATHGGGRSLVGRPSATLARVQLALLPACPKSENRRMPREPALWGVGVAAAAAVLVARRVRRPWQGRGLVPSAGWQLRRRVGMAGTVAEAAPSAVIGEQDPDSFAASVDAELRELGEWCAYVINLDRRPDRLEQMKQLLSTTNPRLLQRLERIEAVDGQKLSFDDEAVQRIVDARTLERAKRAKELGIYSVVHDEDNLLVHFDDHFTEGAIACAMSHHEALMRVASHPTAEWGLILEDDNSVVVPEVDRAIARLLRQLPPDWDALYLGYHHDDGKPHPDGLRLASAAAPVQDHRLASAEAAAAASVVEVPVQEVYKHCWGLFAWMVKKEAAQQLVEHLFPISTQVDGAISGWLVRERGPGRVFCVPPEQLLFYSSCSEEGQDSDIQTMASKDTVVEQYGSWRKYMHLGRDEPSLEELYALYGLGDDPSNVDEFDDDYREEQYCGDE